MRVLAVLYTGRPACRLCIRATLSLQALFSVMVDVHHFMYVYHSPLCANTTNLFENTTVKYYERKNDDSLNAQQSAWNAVLRMIDVNNFRYIMRTRLDVEILYPHLTAAKIVSYRNNKFIYAFCKCHRPELVTRSKLPMQDVLYFGNSQVMARILSARQKNPSNMTNCFMYQDGRDRYECTTILMSPQIDFRVFSNRSEFKLCSSRKEIV